MMNIKAALITKIKHVNSVKLFGIKIQSGTRWSVPVLIVNGLQLLLSAFELTHCSMTVCF